MPLIIHNLAQTNQYESRATSIRTAYTLLSRPTRLLSFTHSLCTTFSTNPPAYVYIPHPQPTRPNVVSLPPLLYHRLESLSRGKD